MRVVPVFVVELREDINHWPASDTGASATVAAAWRAERRLPFQDSLNFIFETDKFWTSVSETAEHC